MYDLSYFVKIIHIFTDSARGSQTWHATLYCLLFKGVKLTIKHINAAILWKTGAGALFYCKLAFYSIAYCDLTLPIVASYCHKRVLNKLYFSPS